MGHPATYRRLIEAADIAPEERVEAAVVSAVLYVVAGASVVIVALLPAVAHGHQGVLTVLAAVTIASSAPVFMLVRSARTPVWALHINQWLALVMIPIVVALTGGAGSPVWFYILFVAIFNSYFFGRPVAIAYLALCVVGQALPLLYDRAASDHPAFLAELICGAPSYVTLGLAISGGKLRSGFLRARAETEAAEQAALRRVASAVADGEPPERIFALAAEEAAGLLDAAGAAILRHDGSESLTVAGQWASNPSQRLPPGEPLPLDTTPDSVGVLRDGRPRRTDAPRPGSRIERLGFRSTLAVPVRLADRMWGVLVVASSRLAAFADKDEQVLLEFGDLLAASISSAEERSRLAEQALSDPLTGLANQRALRSRLEAELARGGRRGSSVSVAMIDIDHFKEINDTAGHDTGDEMLGRVAAALRGFARIEDTVARIGGDEFAWLMPDTRREQALVAIERARRLIAAAPADPYRITISAGICDTDSTEDPQELLRLADSALYWSKEHGRNQAWIYDPAVVHDLTEQQRAVRIERSQALEGLRALVRTREGGDPARRGHTERVAAGAVSLALALGWPRERAMLLSEAATLHDVGRVAGFVAPTLEVDADGVGLAELSSLRAAAAAGADMLAGLLDQEQLTWIGGLYAPVAGGEAVSGAAVLTVADAFDLMTAVAPGGPDDALGELDRLAGSGIVDARVLEALRELLAGGGIGQPDALR